MTSRLASITAWLAVGHAAVFGLFWLLLRVPESNVVMLLASALLVVVSLILVGAVEGAALAAWAPGTSPREALRAAPRAILPALAGIGVFALVWWATGLAGTWWTDHRGEVDAWLMLHFGWTRTTALHTTQAWVLAGVRYAVGASLALALPTASLRVGPAALLRFGWVARAFSPKRLAVTAALLWLFLWLPWQGVYWRPRSLSPNWQEPAFVALKLGLLYLVATAGWALVLGAAWLDGPTQAPVTASAPRAAGAGPEAPRPPLDGPTPDA